MQHNEWIFDLPNGITLTVNQHEAAEWIDGLVKDGERLRLRVEELRGLCKWASGRLFDAGQLDDANMVLELVGDMEP